MPPEASLSNKKEKDELTPPLIQCSLEYLLDLACRSFDSYAIITKKFADEIRKIDPKEEYHHAEDYGNELLIKIYPIAVWRACSAKFYRDKENSEKERQAIFQQEEKYKAIKDLIQRKRDILSEANADVKKRFPNWLQIFGKGLSDWKQQYEFFEYYLFRALNGENEKIRLKFGLEKEVCEEFQKLPADPFWKNRYYHADKELL